jgi:hypothetical protein
VENKIISPIGPGGRGLLVIIAKKWHVLLPTGRQACHPELEKDLIRFFAHSEWQTIAFYSDSW